LKPTGRSASEAKWIGNGKQARSWQIWDEDGGQKFIKQATQFSELVSRAADSSRLEQWQLLEFC